VSIITKNALILRDLDLLIKMNQQRLISVNISLTSLDEKIRLKLEPRTVNAQKKLKVIQTLSDYNIPVNIMVAPVIPGLNSHEIPRIIKEAANHGALSAAYTIVRLNGAIAELFVNWVHKAFPNQAEKILRQIKECHKGSYNDSRFGLRMHGEGVVAKQINRIFLISKQKYLAGRKMPALNCDIFRRNGNQQMSLWES